MGVPIFVWRSLKNAFLYQESQKCHFLVFWVSKIYFCIEGLKINDFWYWGSRKCIFEYKGLKITNIWYWEYRKSNFLVYGGGHENSQNVIPFPSPE